ncbi:MAG: lmo0937 family membrane protein [Ignavibacteriales bacterium]|nr:MAG: lmo0937 family membrane protein [Ignavibacteriales bacterium]
MLWTIIVILAVLWLLGLLFEIGGGIVHILLVIAVILVIVNLVSGRKTL